MAVDGDRAAGRGVADGVGHDVIDDLTDAHGVAEKRLTGGMHRIAAVHAEFDAALPRRNLHRGRFVRYQPANVDRAQVAMHRRGRRRAAFDDFEILDEPVDFFQGLENGVKPSPRRLQSLVDKSLDVRDSHRKVVAHLMNDRSHVPAILYPTPNTVRI